MTMANVRTVRIRLTAAIAVLIAGAPAGLAATASRTAGDQRSWTLDFRARLEQPGGRQPVEVRIEGDLVSTISAVRPGEYDAAIEIARARVVGEGGPGVQAGAGEELRHRMERRFWATYRDDGTLLVVHFFQDVGPGDRNVLQLILSETQFVRPVSAGPVWTVIERDGAGSYLAIYQQVASNAVLKRKLKYVETSGVAGAPSGALHVALDGSELRFAFDAQGEVTALDGSNRVKIEAPVANADQISASMEVHLTNLRRSRADGLIGSLAAALPNVASLPVVTHQVDPEVARRQRDEQLLDGQSTESLLNASFTDTTDATLADRLAALFRRRPEAARAALVLLQAHGRQTRITDALGRAGSPEATATLGRLARERSGYTPLRVDALIGLAMAEHGSIESMHIAAGLLDDADPAVASAARMVAGALARASRAEHPTEADAIDAALIERYKCAAAERDLASVLAGLGNSASPAAAALIEEALRDSRPAVRAVAVRALRLTQGPEIDGLLSQTIASDSDAGVRAGAIFAAGFHYPFDSTLGNAVLQAARTDPADSVRSSAVTLLARTAGKSAQISETLAWIAANDTTPGIRRKAREALGSSGAPAKQ
jgi:hypothetical protein